MSDKEENKTLEEAAYKFLLEKGCSGQIKTLRISPPSTKPSDGTLIDWMVEFAKEQSDKIPFESVSDEDLKQAGLQVEEEFRMGGFSDGIYMDFAIGVYRQIQKNKGIIDPNKPVPMPLFIQEIEVNTLKSLSYEQINSIMHQLHTKAKD